MVGAWDTRDHSTTGARGQAATPPAAHARAALDNPRHPHRWNRYAYVGGAPLWYADPSGYDAIAVNFSGMADGWGHEGIVLIREDGTAEYASFGPASEFGPLGLLSQAAGQWVPGQINTLELGKIQMGPDGLPTSAAFQNIAKLVAKAENAPVSSVSMNYFATTKEGDRNLQNYINTLKLFSELGALQYNVLRCNCADFAMDGLAAAGAVPDGTAYMAAPNDMESEQLIDLALETWANGVITLNPTLPPTCVQVNNGPKTCTP